MNKRVLKSVNLPFFNSIPVEWKLKKIKHIAKVGSSKRVFEDQYQSEGIPFFRSKEIVELANNKEISVDLYIEDSLYRNFVNNYNAPQKGDMLITSIGTIGKVWISDGREFYYKDGNITQLTSSKEVEIEFIKYCFQSELFKEQYRLMSAGSTLMALSIEKIKELVIYIPTLNEQKKIIEFLNNKISEVSNIIESKYKLIKLLEQQRQSIITEAVTKGLNPNVKMKDSGVEWIGEIPEHWNVRKIKEIANVYSSNVDKKSIEGEKEVLLCNYVDVYYNDSITAEIDFMKATAKDEQIETFTLKKHDVIITKDSESPTDIAIPTWVSQELEGVVCGYHLSLIRCFENTLGHYLYYNLESVQIREQFYTRANGVTRYGLSKEAIKKGLIAVPPYNEQIQIAEKLYVVNKEIRNMTEKVKEQISKLKEYRQALIYEAVTGKIDIRDMELD